MKKLLTVLLTVMMAFTTITFNVVADEEKVSDPKPDFTFTVTVTTPKVDDAGFSISFNPSTTAKTEWQIWDDDAGEWKDYKIGGPGPADPKTIVEGYYRLQKIELNLGETNKNKKVQLTGSVLSDITQAKNDGKVIFEVKKEETKTNKSSGLCFVDVKAESVPTMICLLVKQNATADPDYFGYPINENMTWAAYKDNYPAGTTFYKDASDDTSIYDGDFSVTSLYTSLKNANTKTLVQFLVGKESDSNYDGLRMWASFGEAYENMYVVELYTTANPVVYHTVTFNYDNGTEAYTPAVLDNETVEAPVDPTKEGYTFDGWFEKKEDGSLKETAYDFTKPVTSDLQLFAKWTALPTVYTVTFHDGSKTTKVDVVEGEAIAAGQFPTWTKDNYLLDGWYDVTETNKYDGESITEDTDLYAVWVKNVFAVTFYIDDKAVAVQGIEKNNKAVDPEITKEGYVIEGWYEKNEDETFTKFNFDTLIIEDINLYAKLLKEVKVANVKVDPSTSAYTGRRQYATLVGLDGLDYTVQYKDANNKYARWSSSARNVGEYDVKVTINSVDTVFSNGTKELVLKKSFRIVNVLTASFADKTYNFKNQYPTVRDLTVVGSDGRRVQLGRNDVTIVKVEARPYSYIPVLVEAEECVDAKTYYVTVKLNNSNYSFADGKNETVVEYTINKAALSLRRTFDRNDIELLPSRLVYNGQEQQPYSDELLEKFGLAYVPTEECDNSAVNAGHYTARLALYNNNLYWHDFTGSLTNDVDWTIEKANLDKVQIYPRRPVALKGFHADCLINNIGMYEEGTKFEEYVWGEGWVELNVAENGLVLLNEGWHTIRAKADDNHNEVGLFDLTTVFVATSPVDYTLSGSAYKGDKKAVVTCDREDYDALSEVRIQIGDEVIVLGYDQYTVEKGSTKVTITDKNLVSTLAVGEYKVGFIYNDGMHVTGNLVIKNRPVTPYVAPKTGVE